MLGPSIDTARQTVAGLNVISPVGAPLAADRQRPGSYRGEAVIPATENSKITLATTTRGVSVQSAVNNLAALAQRSIAQGRATFLEASARSGALQDKLPDMPGPKQLGRLIRDFDRIRHDLANPDAATEAVADEIAAEFGSEIAAQEEASSVVEEVHVETEHGESQRDAGQASYDTGSLVERLRVTQQRDKGDGSFGSGGDNQAAEEILSALERFDPDPTHQFAALENLRSYFAHASDQFQLVLDQAMAVYEQNTDLARAVRAGYAAAEIAHRSAAKLGTDPRKFREAYRAMLREQPNLGTLFDALVDRFGMTGSFEEIVEAFLIAAGRDLASTGPSSDELFLHALTTELGKLKKMRTVYESGKELIKLTDRIAVPAERGKLEPTQLTSRMLNFCAKRAAVGIADARALLGPMQSASPQYQVVLVNGLVGLHADIPDDVMPSAQALLQQKTILATFLTHLVEAEERFYEAGKSA